METDATATYYTTAPEAYDGFGTTTLDAAAGTDARGHTIRKVGIREDAFDWQTSRYLSGLYGTFPAAEVESEGKLGWTMREEAAS